MSSSDLPATAPAIITPPVATAAVPPATASTAAATVAPSSTTASLTANPYFSAGFGLIGVTAGLAVLRTAAQHALLYAQRRLLVRLEITSKDPAYNWFLSWMAANTRASRSHDLSVETSFARRDSGTAVASLSLVPGPGTHYFRHRRRWFRVDRQRERNMVDLKSGSPWETIAVTTLSRDRDLLREMLEDAKRAALARDEGKLLVFTSVGPEWRPFGAPRRRRPLQSVVLHAGVANRIRSDVVRFIHGAQWYQDRGIPYRRGYLLHGPPGGGKSSFIQALAGDLDYSICVLNMSERGMTDDRLAHLLANTPPRSFILLEDIDAAFPNRDAAVLAAAADAAAANSMADPSMLRMGRHAGPTTMVTFSGLLNALDGVASAEERIVFMTTNHPERLDAALVRPGRVDVRVHIGPADADQALQLFRHFYPDATASQCALFNSNFAPLADKVSPAQLQGFFVIHRDDCQAAAEQAGDVCNV